MIRTYLFTLVTGILLITSSACDTAVEQHKNQEEVTTYILVRHAEKEDDGTKDPALNAQGKQRAERLAQMLLPAEVGGIYSTNYQRTQQTAMPLAEKMGLKITAYLPLQEKDLLNIQKEASGKTVLIVGHSNTIPVMVNQLIGKERFDQLEEDEYDKLFVVSIIGKLADVTILSY